MRVTTQTQGYMTGTKGMGKLKVTDSQSKPAKFLNNVKHLSLYKFVSFLITHHIPHFSILKIPSQTQIMHLVQTIIIKLSEYIKHIKTC